MSFKKNKQKKPQEFYSVNLIHHSTKNDQISCIITQIKLPEYLNLFIFKASNGLTVNLQSV